MCIIFIHLIFDFSVLSNFPTIFLNSLALVHHLSSALLNCHAHTRIHAYTNVDPSHLGFFLQKTSFSPNVLSFFFIQLKSLNILALTTLCLIFSVEKVFFSPWKIFAKVSFFFANKHSLRLLFWAHEMDSGARVPHTLISENFSSWKRK